MLDIFDKNLHLIGYSIGISGLHVNNEMTVLNSGWNKQDRKLYKIRIKALVAPLYPEKERLSAKLNLSRTILRGGEEVKIYYEANSDCYIYLFSVAADGSVTLLHGVNPAFHEAGHVIFGFFGNFLAVFGGT